MNVSAIIPTRGNVDMQPVVESMPEGWEVLVWDNRRGEVLERCPSGLAFRADVPDPHDLGPHARFAAIAYAAHPLIYVQDDDVIVSDPQAIVDEFVEENHPGDPDFVVCNIPAEFRRHYPDSGMVGFGAAFHSDTPERAFARFFARFKNMRRDDPLFLRESCRIVTTLTPIVRVDVAKTDREFASDPDRLWKQPDHFWAAQRMIKLARIARDA